MRMNKIFIFNIKMKKIRIVMLRSVKIVLQILSKGSVDSSDNEMVLPPAQRINYSYELKIT